jgi:hypothetical protein
MEGCLANIVKYLLFATNFAVFIMGCVVLGIGIFAMVDGAALVDLVNNSGTDVSITIFTSAPIILIVVSVFVIIVTFFGCCGAIKENRCMLGTYFTIILVLFIVMIVGAVVGYSQSMEEIDKAVTKTMELYKDDPNLSGVTDNEKAITEAWDAIQGQDAFDCCGTYMTINETNSYNSWVDISDQYPTTPTGGFQVPTSCCVKFGSAKVDQCRKFPFDAEFELTGCITKLEDTFEQNKNVILAVGVSVVVIMFLNMLFAFAMCTMSR